jgi:hypothetical protein
VLFFARLVGIGTADEAIGGPVAEVAEDRASYFSLGLFMQISVPIVRLKL